MPAENAKPIRPAAGRPTHRRCPSINAATILEIAEGRLSVDRAMRVATVPAAAAETVPLVGKPRGYASKQPHRSRFNAADIYELSLAAHPWQAPVIEKPVIEKPATEQLAGEAAPPTPAETNRRAG
ncbi:MAG: hypothetical protein AAGB00_02730 [Planctomycetota bacterium]